MRLSSEPIHRRPARGLILGAVMILACPMSAPAQPDVYVYPAGCFDAYGRPLNPNPANPAQSADPACRPPQSGTLLQGGRSSSSPPASGPTMQRGSINLPPTPVPVPGGIGVMNP